MKRIVPAVQIDAKVIENCSSCPERCSEFDVCGLIYGGGCKVISNMSIPDDSEFVNGFPTFCPLEIQDEQETLIAELIEASGNYASWLVGRSIDIHPHQAIEQYEPVFKMLTKVKEQIKN